MAKHYALRDRTGRLFYDDLYQAGALALLETIRRKGTSDFAWIYAKQTIHSGFDKAIRAKDVTGPKSAKKPVKPWRIIYFRDAKYDNSSGSEVDDYGFTIDDVRHFTPTDTQLSVSLEWALSQLKEREALAVRLRFIGDLTPAEMATELGVSRQAAEQTLSKALDKLRKLLNRR